MRQGARDWAAPLWAGGRWYRPVCRAAGATRRWSPSPSRRGDDRCGDGHRGSSGAVQPRGWAYRWVHSNWGPWHGFGKAGDRQVHRLRGSAWGGSSVGAPARKNESAPEYRVSRYRTQHCAVAGSAGRHCRASCLPGTTDTPPGRLPQTARYKTKVGWEWNVPRTGGRFRYRIGHATGSTDAARAPSSTARSVPAARATARLSGSGTALR